MHGAGGRAGKQPALRGSGQPLDVARIDERDLLGGEAAGGDLHGELLADGGDGGERVEAGVLQEAVIGGADVGSGGGCAAQESRRFEIGIVQGAGRPDGRGGAIGGICTAGELLDGADGQDRGQSAEARGGAKAKAALGVGHPAILRRVVELGGDRFVALARRGGRRGGAHFDRIEGSYRQQRRAGVRCGEEVVARRGHEEPIERRGCVEPREQRGLSGEWAVALPQLVGAIGGGVADDDEFFARARHRDVEQAKLLLAIADAALPAEHDVVDGHEFAALDTVEDAQAEAAAAVELKRVVRAAVVESCAGVQQEHDGEFEPLGGVDGHDSHDVFALSGRGLEFLRFERVEVRDELGRAAPAVGGELLGEFQECVKLRRAVLAAAQPAHDVGELRVGKDAAQERGKVAVARRDAPGVEPRLRH